MRTERVFQICVSIMAVLATLMLATSQSNNLLPVVAFFAAMTALIFTDILGWFSFHPFVAGTFGLGAGLYAFTQMQTGGLEGQFVSVANLLIHLQIILLFQKKSIRIYWQLITLSLLQVVVASALNMFVFFGPLLVLYSGVAMLALIAFFIYRETQTTAKTERKSKKPAVIVIEPPEANSAANPRRRLMRSSGWRSYGLLSTGSLVAASAVFLFMPRFGDGVWRPGNTGMATTGFSGTVDLSDVGDLYENPTMVMRVSFLDEATKKPYLVSNTPYLRGSVSDEYRRGRWSRLREMTPDDLSALPRPQRIFSAVRQSVSFETPKGGIVFTLAPVCALDDTSGALRIEERTNEVRSVLGSNEDSGSYSLGTLSLHNGQQSEYSSIRRPLSVDNERRRKLTVLRGQPEIAELATQVVNDAGVESALERARVLEAFFKDRQQGFKYSLDATTERKRGLDPVVDFVTNHRTGHCQYFASALALMLRSQGIPARIVVGYLGRNYNDIGNYYEIREMDAHAWVEAAIPADEIPLDEVIPREGIPGDAWVRLDPTPQADIVLESVTISPWREKVGDTLDYMQLLWSEYVLGLNEKRQKRRIYEPIQAFFRNAAASLFSFDSWAARWEGLLNGFQGDLFSQENFRDSSFAVILLLISVFALRTVWRFLASSIASWRGQRKILGPQVEFYRQLEKMLRNHGLRRRAEQTAREFAITAGERLRRAEADPALAGVPEQAVDLFYRVRFGGASLSEAEQDRIQDSLRGLKEFLTNRKRSILK